MKNFNYIITDEIGIHARPAGLIVAITKKYASKITIKANKKIADGTNLMAIIALAVKKGTTVTVSAKGQDDELVIAELEELFKSYL